MICSFAETNLSNFTIFLYTCLCIPFMNAASRIFVFLIDPHHQPKSGVSEEWELDLSLSRFRDLKSSEDGEEEVCAVCLLEFEGEDKVNELGRCGHVFHVGCLEKWLDRCQFTCPLCRSSVLRVCSSPCRNWTSPFCINLTHANDCS
ncbi:hypothetical protein ACS0TY_036180 [Phlomoides rotata]